MATHVTAMLALLVLVQVMVLVASHTPSTYTRPYLLRRFRLLYAARSGSAIDAALAAVLAAVWLRVTRPVLLLRCLLADEPAVDVAICNHAKNLLCLGAHSTTKSKCAPTADLRT